RQVHQALARRELAEQLLRDTDYSLAEVAFLTGFAEQSGFTRAFKRWAGQTPRSYRMGGDLS
ncbi:MAG: helix-turn-helix domain-containing protein, partial [Pseudomonadota bacterium]